MNQIKVTLFAVLYAIVQVMGLAPDLQHAVSFVTTLPGVPNLNPQTVFNVLAVALLLYIGIERFYPGVGASLSAWETNGLNWLRNFRKPDPNLKAILDVVSGLDTRITAIENTLPGAGAALSVMTATDAQRDALATSQTVKVDPVVTGTSTGAPQ